MEQTINDILREKLAPEIIRNILCFDHWETPEDFFTISSQDRAKLIGKYKLHTKPATEKNIWIWFGSYSTARQTPIHNKLPVVRKLYEALVAPVPDGRLRGLFAMSKGDVNPYKFFLAREKAAALMVNGVISHQMNDKEQLLLKEIKTYINDYFDPHMVNTKDIMRKMALSNGYPLFLINEALKDSQLGFIA